MATAMSLPAAHCRKAICLTKDPSRPLLCARPGNWLARGAAPTVPGQKSRTQGALASIRRQRNPRCTIVAAAESLPSNSSGSSSSGAGVLYSARQQLKALFSPFSDERCNAQLLALAVGQALCSVATLIHDSYLPVYVHDELGLSTTEIGAVQGAAQFLCQLAKGASGVAGDLLGSQVRVLVFGTALTLACKPMFAMLGWVSAAFGTAACVWWFFSAKLFDRLSKGIREAPTKAVMNELAQRAGDAPDAAYGLRQSLATAGMLVGSTTAAAVFALSGHNYTATFALAAVPTALALAWLVQNFSEELFGDSKKKKAAAAAAAANKTSPVETTTTGTAPAVSTPLDQQTSSTSPSSSIPSPPPPPAEGASSMVAASAAAAQPEEPQLSFLEKARVVLGAFKPVYWQALLVVAVLYFTRFDASFLSLRAKSIMPKSMLPMLTLMNSLLQVTLTAPLARLSGTNVRSRNRLLLAGFGIMLAAHACFGLPAFATPTGMFVGAALLGCHMAATHAITVSMVASYMPTGVLPGVGRLSGTAVSFTDLLLGFILAASNTVAGVLSDLTRQAGLGNTGCFAGGAVACVAAGALLVLFERFGDLGKDELVVGKSARIKAKAT